MPYREKLNMHPQIPPATWHSPIALTMFYDLVLALVDPERHLGHDLHHSSSQSLKYEKAGCSCIIVRIAAVGPTRKPESADRSILLQHANYFRSQIIIRRTVFSLKVEDTNSK